MCRILLEVPTLDIIIILFIVMSVIMGGECRMAGVAVATPTFCPFIIIGHTNFDLLVNQLCFGHTNFGNHPLPMSVIM